MKVVLVFDFPEVTDPDSETADAVLHSCFGNADLYRFADETGATSVTLEEVYQPEGEKQ